MDFSDIVLDEFKSDKDEQLLYEQGILMTPFLAYSSFKKDIFSKIKDSFKDIKEKPGKFIKKFAAGAKKEKEKARAALGITSGKGEGATVYKLNDEQMEVMEEIWKKYGDELVDEILRFRRNILAPYELIKRKVSQSSRVSSKDIAGMTKEQYERAVESGRKKIEKRGENYFEKSQEIQDKLRKVTKQIETLKETESEFKGDGKISQTVINRLYKSFGVSDTDLEGYSPEELRRTYDEIRKNYDDIINQVQKTQAGEPDLERGSELRQRQKHLLAGKNIDLTKSEKEEFYKRGSFNTALGKYFFRREILNRLRPHESNVFRETYLSIIQNMRNELQERRQKLLDDLKKLKKSVEFNEKESAIWKKLPTVKTFSGNVDDYYKAVESEDLPDKPIHIEKSEKLREAEQQIENEIRRFERSLKKIISEEDFRKLKQYRLINNLITVRELKDSEKLFKSSKELKSTASGEDKNDEQKRDNEEQ